MSTIRLLKDRGADKAGAVISVSFAVGKVLIAEGVAEYPDAKRAVATAKGGEVKHVEKAEPAEPVAEPLKPEFPPEPQATTQAKPASHDKKQK